MDSEVNFADPFKVVYPSKKEKRSTDNGENFCYCDGTQTHIHLVCKQTINHFANPGKFVSFRLQIKWLWVRVMLQSLEYQICHLFRARSSFTFSQLQSVASL